MAFALRTWISAALIAVGAATLVVAGALLLINTSTSDGAPCGSVLQPRAFPNMAVVGGDSVDQPQACALRRQEREIAAILTGIGGLTVLCGGFLVATSAENVRM